MKIAYLSIITIGLSESEICTTLLPLQMLLKSAHVESIVVTPVITSHLRMSLPFSSFYKDDRKGVYQAMNHALGKAKGSYVWFLNAGDQSLLNPHSGQPALSIIRSIIDKALSPRDLPIIIFGTKLLADPLLAPLSRSIFALTLLSLGMPSSHQNILIPRQLHSEFTYAYRHSSDYYLLNKMVFQNNSSVLYAPSQKIARLVPGGISDLNRLDVFIERFHISLSVHRVSVIILIFPCLFIRLARELLARAAKSILVLLAHARSSS